MTLNYANRLPYDGGNTPMQNWPAPYRASVSTMTENAAISSIINLQPNTRQVEVYASGGQGVAIRWVPTAETAATFPRGSVVASGLGANFDHIVPPGTYRQFVVPRDTQGQGLGTVNQAGSIYGLIQGLARINAGGGASSVLVSEF